MVTLFKKLFWPHHGNDHHPHAIRHPALALYAAFLLLFNVGINVASGSDGQVLGFASSISQQQLIALTNQERAKAGVPVLRENEQLNEAARRKAQNMFAEDYWAHYSPSGKSPWVWFDGVSYAYTLAGENLARDFDTSQGVITGWLNSPTHRDNMLAAGYKDIGIAVVNGTLGGHDTTLVVQHFGTPVVLAATQQPAQAKSPAAQNLQPRTTPAAIPTIAPIELPVEDRQVGQETVAPALTGAAGIPAASFQTLGDMPARLLNPGPPATWSLQQGLTIMFLFGLLLLFAVDSTVLYRKGILRHHSHSGLHVGALAGLLLLVLYSTTGSLL